MVLKKLRINRNAIVYPLIFLISYCLFLLFWLQVKEYYARSLTYAASYITSYAKDIDFKYIVEDKETNNIKAVFFIYRQGKGGKLAESAGLDTDVYTFNAPLTFAIMALLFMAAKRGKIVFFEAVLFLLFLHLFFIIVMQIESISWLMVQGGFEKANLLNRALWPFLWQFFYEVVRLFEPFLVGVYIFLRTYTLGGSSTLRVQNAETGLI